MMNYDGSCRKLITEVNSNSLHAMVYWTGFLYWTDIGSRSVIYMTSVLDGTTFNSGIALTYPVRAIEFYGHGENCKFGSVFYLHFFYFFLYVR